MSRTESERLIVVTGRWAASVGVRVLWPFTRGEREGGRRGRVSY